PRPAGTGRHAGRALGSAPAHGPLDTTAPARGSLRAAATGASPDLSVASPDLLARTAELVAIPSESFSEGPLTDAIEAELRALPHLVVERVGENVVARTTLGRDIRVVLAGHTDTVPAKGNSTARVDGDVLW